MGAIFAGMLISLGTYSQVVQRIVVTLPNPLIASFIGGAISIAANLNSFVYLLILICGSIVIFGLTILLRNWVLNIFQDYHSCIKTNCTHNSDLNNKIREAAKRNLNSYVNISNSTATSWDNASEIDAGDSSANMNQLLEEEELRNIYATEEIHESRRKMSLQRRQLLQRKRLMMRVREKSKAFGRRRLSSVNFSSFRERNFAASLNDDVTEPVNSVICPNDDDNSDPELNAWLHDRRNCAKSERRPTAIFDIERDAIEASTQLKIHQQLRRRKMKERLKFRVRGRASSYKDLIASSSDTDAEEANAEWNLNSSEESSIGEIQIVQVRVAKPKMRKTRNVKLKRIRKKKLRSKKS